jgi:hypothetical protein
MWGRNIESQGSNSVLIKVVELHVITIYIMNVQLMSLLNYII